MSLTTSASATTPKTLSTHSYIPSNTPDDPTAFAHSSSSRPLTARQHTVDEGLIVTNLRRFHRPGTDRRATYEASPVRLPPDGSCAERLIELPGSLHLVTMQIG